MSSPLELLAGLGQNIALALALCFIEERMFHRLSRLGNTGRQLCMGLLFACMALISMQLPINISPGVTIDTRVVLVSLAGAFYGLPAALVAVLTVASYRLHLGGAGAVAGAAAILQGGALGVLLFRQVKGQVAHIGYLHLLLFGIAIAAGSLFCCVLLCSAACGSDLELT